MGKCFIAVLVLATGFLCAQAKGTLTISLEGVRNDQGHILVMAQNMENPEGIEAEQLRSLEGEMTIVFSDMEDGEYMIQLFHDENDNLMMDMDSSGMPSEGWAMEKGVSAHSGYLPPFVKIDGADAKVELVMHYPGWE